MNFSVTHVVTNMTTMVAHSHEVPVDEGMGRPGTFIFPGRRLGIPARRASFRHEEVRGETSRGRRETGDDADPWISPRALKTAAADDRGEDDARVGGRFE